MIKKVSDKKKYRDKHSGIKYSQVDLNKGKAEAARILFENQFNEEGYNFCENCGVNSSSSKLDPAHIKSIDWCKKNSEIELIMSVDNHKILCREKCHRNFDGLNLRFKKG